MKKKLRGIKRSTQQLDFNLYRVEVPMPDTSTHSLSVIDMAPEGVERTIMFVHGYAGCAETWEHQINHFSHNYRVVVPDLRGHGQSDAPYTRYTMDELVEDLQAVVTHLNLPEKFILIGHSFGGSICVEYANRYPEHLEKLVLIATAGEYPLPRAASLAFRIPTATLRPLWRYRPRWNAELHVMKRMMMNNLRQWHGWPLLRNIQTPTLVITGERDNYFPRYVFDDVGKMVPNAEIYDVGSAKHKVQLERHQAVNRAIERFIEGNKHRLWRTQENGDGLLNRRPWLPAYGKDVPRTIPIPRQPLHRFLEGAADWVPKRKAIIYYGISMTYAQLDALANQFAHALLARGVKQGDRVMIVMPNAPQFVAAYYGALKVGAVVVLPNPDADMPQIVRQLQSTQASVLVTLSVHTPLLEAVREYAGTPHIILADVQPVNAIIGYLKMLGIDLPEVHLTSMHQPKLGEMWDDIVRNQPITPPSIDVKHTDLAAIVYTSGTTDDPKGVKLSHSNLVANALQTRHWIPGLSYGKETVLSIIPFMHSYGMTAAMNVPILLGATMILLSVFELQQVLEHIKRYRPTLFPGVPSMYTIINQAPNVRAYGLDSVKACISGAAPLPVEVQEAFEKLTRGRLVEGYGLTEASPVTHANPLYGVRKVGCIGVPLPNTDARIVDLTTGEDLAPGQIGELVIRGPQVMQGYWENDNDSESAIRDGWLYTGDVAVMDTDGYFQIISRKRDTILAGQYSVYPRDVEEILYENSKVLEAAVVGVGRAEEGQKVKAFVVPRKGTKLTKEELLELCRRRLEPYAVPWDIEFREELPKSFVGKVLRRLLIEEE